MFMCNFLVQEYKVSLYAQHLGTALKVSNKRIMKILESYKLD